MKQAKDKMNTIDKYNREKYQRISVSKKSYVKIKKIAKKEQKSIVKVI